MPERGSGGSDGARTALGEAVRAAREAAGLTQEELAERAGGSVRGVRNLETGRVTRPHPGTVDRLATALGLDEAARATLTDRARGRASREPGTKVLPLVPSAPPEQLPPDAPDLVGRDETAGLLATLRAPDGGAPGIAVLTGPAGIGKTTLAVHLGHRLRERFPDGRLYVELAGAGARPVPPAEALETVLAGLGVAVEHLPRTAAARAALYRSRLAGRRLLVVLDDAADATQVRPLLPGVPGCAVVVTSRRSMADLPATTYVALTGLTDDRALALLGAVAGRDRITAEPTAARAVSAACGGLPLALRIAGARLAARPAWDVRDLAARLTAPRQLDELASGELRVGDTLAASYRLLGPEAARAFRLLGVLDHPGYGTGLVAALLDRDAAVTERLLEDLADLHLLDSPRPGAYRLHDLLHALARRLTREHDPVADRKAALGRAVAAQTAAARAAAAILRPADLAGAPPPDPIRRPFRDRDDALRWFGTEWTGLVSLARQAGRPAGRGDDTRDGDERTDGGTDGTGDPLGAGRLLADALAYLHVRGDWVTYERLAGEMLVLAERAGDEELTATAHLRLGRALAGSRQLAAAARHQDLALAGFCRLGSRTGEALALDAIGARLCFEERYADALGVAEQALAAWRVIGEPHGLAGARHALGLCLAGVGRPDEAETALADSLDRYERAGDVRETVRTLNHIALTRVVAGRPALALAPLDRAMALNASAGARDHDVAVLDTRAMALTRLGRPAEARTALDRCLALNREAGDVLGVARTLVSLAVVADALGEPADAGRHRASAVRIAAGADPVEAARLQAALDRDPGHWGP